MCANSYVCDYVKRVLILLIFVIKLVFAIFICFDLIFTLYLGYVINPLQRPMDFSIKFDTVDPG